MRALIGCLAYLLVSMPTEADVYRKIENGQVIFSDQPFDGAEKIPDKPVNTVPAYQSGKAKKPKSGEAQAKSKKEAYSIAIGSPADGKTYLHGESISVAVSVTPGMVEGDKLDITLDGSPLSAGSGSLPDLERGSHTLKASVVDAEGQSLVDKSVTFNIYQPSQLQHH